MTRRPSAAPRTPFDGGRRPVVIIAGPTASGKSRLAIAAAAHFDGTIVNADALQIYRELRLLTARPGGADLRRARHRLYGVLDGREPCSAGRWRDMALAEVDAAHGAGHCPIVVGGTGLYLRALMGGLAPIPEIPDDIRASARRRLEEIGPEAFHGELAARDPETAARLSAADRQRTLRAWEILAFTGRPQVHWLELDGGAPPANLRFLTILIMPPREPLYAACDARFARMIDAGAVDEARSLKALDLAPDLPVMKAVGVRPLLSYLDGAVSLAESCRLGQRDTRRYAKRQTTWYRHQMAADHAIIEQYSESLNEKIFSFISDFLLTDPA